MTRSKKIIRFNSTLIVIILIIFVSARMEVGVDWHAYLRFYEGIDSTEGLEFGYAAINNFFKTINLNYNAYLLIINIFCLLLFRSYLINLKALSSVALLIFFSDIYLYYNFSGMRQAIATALTCYAFRFAIERRLVKFFLVLFLAASFHLSALVSIIIFYIPRKRPHVKHVFVFFIAILLVSTQLDYIADIISEHTIKNAVYYLEVIEKQEEIEKFFAIGMIKRLLIIILSFIAWRYIQNVDNIIYIINIYVFGVFIYAFSYLLSADVAVRLSSYFLILDCVLYSIILLNIPSLNQRIILFALVSSIAFYKIFGYTNDIAYNYSTFLNL